MHKLLVVLVCVTLIASPPFASAAPDTREGGPRIRLTDTRLSQLMQNGIMRSPTLKTLVDRIERSDVIVYVSLSPLLRSHLSGKLAWMARAGGYRYLRAQISTDLNPDQMIATIAHELQHALEVSEDRAVVDQRSLVELYKRIGRESRASIVGEYETVAAQQAGLQVRRELVAVPAVLARANGPDRL